MKYDDQAREHFERAVRRLPDARRPRLRLAECLLKLGEAREAERHLRALDERSPDDPGVLLALARLHEYRGQVTEARRASDRLLDLRPAHGDGLVERGHLELHHGDARDALPGLRRAVEAHPGRADAWEALARCQEALEQSAEAQHSRDELARVKRELGELTRLALVVTQEKANDVALRAEVAERYERLGDFDRAIPWRICVLQLDPAHRPTHAALANLFEKTGQPHRAARHRALAAAGGTPPRAP
jgi:predicted Zn-dependent protease